MLAGRRGIMGAGLVALLIALVGCGGAKRGAVSGQVTLDGIPVDGGEIRFLPSAGTPAWAEIVQGRYTIHAAKGPSLGMARVEVCWSRKTGKRRPTVPPAGPGTIEETVEAIPTRYNRDSKLQADVKPGDNQFDFALRSR